MKTKLLFAMAIILLGLKVNAQFDINGLGQVQLIANTSDWMTAFRTVVPTYNSCSYNLYYGGKDRFFVHASGYLWCERGGYFGSDSSLKEIISRIESPLSQLKKLNGYEYYFKSKIKKHPKTIGAPQVNPKMKGGLV